MKCCRVEWNSGTPDRFLKRTRFDGWSMSLCDEEGRVVLNVRDAQDFTRDVSTDFWTCLVFPARLLMTGVTRNDVGSPYEFLLKQPARNLEL